MPYQWDPRMGQLVWVDENAALSGGILPDSFWYAPAPEGGGGGGGLGDGAPADAGPSGGRSTPAPAPRPAPKVQRAPPATITPRTTVTQAQPPAATRRKETPAEKEAREERESGRRPITGKPPISESGVQQTTAEGGSPPGEVMQDPVRQAPRGKTSVVAPTMQPTGDPWVRQLQGTNDDWNYEVERENQEWYNNRRYLDNQDNINQQQWEQSTAANVADLSGRRDYYNADDRAALGDYTNANNAALGTYNTRADELYNTQVPMLTAAQWTSNPSDIRNQNQALGNFNDIYGGSLDYQSQAAQAYADPATISAQWDVYGQLQGAAGGSLDTISQAAQAYASAETVGEQKAALAHLKALANREGMSWEQLDEVIGEYKKLSNPEITDQERFILTEFQQRREDLERSRREAVMSDMAARGLRSGAAESTSMLNSQQEMGREAVLTELGAHANAIERADRNRQMWGEGAKFALGAEQQAAGMYYDAAGQLRSQEFDEAYSRGLAADQTAIANSNRRLQAMGMSANQINEMRNASFNEAYSRGVAADNASANNQSTRLAGAVNFGNQANTMRSQNDAVGMFNTGQQNVVGMNNQQVQLADLQRRQGVNDGQINTNVAVNTGNFNAATGVSNANFNARTGVNSTGYARDNDVIGAQQGLINGTQSGRQVVNNQARETGDKRQTVFTNTAGQRATTRNNIAATDYVMRTGKQLPSGGGGNYRVSG